MSRRAKLSFLFGALLAFTFMTNSFIKGELETSEEIKTSLIAGFLAAFVSGALLYFFIKDSQIDKIWGKKKEE